MQTQLQSVPIGKPVTVVYSATCYFLFGKTISVMVGEAYELGCWYGPPSAAAINWLLRDPDHCASQLEDYWKTLH